MSARGPGLDRRFGVWLGWAQSITSSAIQVPLWVLTGYWIDSQLGTLPFGLLVGSAIGLLSAFWMLYRLIRWLERGTQPSPARDQE